MDILSILCILMTLIFGHTISGQKTGVIDCTNDELVTSIFNDPIDLTLRGIIKIYENVTVNRILSTTNNEFDHNYIDARLEGSNMSGARDLTLFTTEHFANYAKEQTAARITLKINLGCGMGKERVVIFFQPLKEGNYFSPIFSKRLYELFVPTPIFAGFDLTAFLEITATDDDLTHNHILFTSNDSLNRYIRVGTKNATRADKKTYFANLILEKILLEIAQPIEFEITATDSGVPPKSSTASVKIRSDPKRSLPPKPRFIQTLYTGVIGLDFNMGPIQIQLSNGTYSSDVKFSLNGIGAQDFRIQDNRNGTIYIVWNSKNLDRSDILKHKPWDLEVKAEHKILAEMGSANILVELVDIKNYFHFMSSYYEGSINELGELNMNPIIFNPYTYQPDVEFTLQSQYDFFYVSKDNFTIQLELNNNFTWHAISDIGYLKLELQASWESLSSITNVVIKLPQVKSVTRKQTFQFEKPLYVGQLKTLYNNLELETIVLKTDVSPTEDIEYNLTGDGSDKFFMMQNLNHIRVEIKANFNQSSQQEDEYESPYLLILEAKYEDMKTYASVVINAVPYAVNNGIKGKILLTSFVQGSIFIRNASQLLSIDSIVVANGLADKFGNELKFHLKGDQSLHFDLKENRTNHIVDIALKTPIPFNILTTKHLLNLTLQAFLSGPDGFNDSLIVFIELPIKECPVNITLLPNPPKFSNRNYVFTVDTGYTGTLGMVSALSKGTHTPLHYILGIQDDELAQRLSINPFTGELTLYGIIEEGNYLFNITAENTETHERAIVKALLKVLQKEECRLFEGVAVEKTLMIVEVDEEKPNYGVLDLKFNDNCTFHIVDMWPNDKDYVHVNYIFTLLDTISIDREDEIFQNMSEPQVLVKLRLECEKEDNERNLTIDIIQQIEQRALQINFTQDMPYAPDIMWLYIKIKDINDNPPEFNISEGPIYLGYPAGNADFHIYPEYLTQIDAFDKDIGFNAKILFTMRDNPYFDIEPNSGKIYPKGKVLSKNEQTELIIFATDQYGEGLISGTVVVVKGLSSDFYSLITLKEYSAHTKQQVENYLSQETGFNINVLKMSYVPEKQPQKSNANEDQSLRCKAWIYAYDKHQRLVTHKEMQEQILVKNPEANVVNMQSYKEAALHLSPRDNSNLTYLIATIVLSLTSCFSLIFIIWRFCCKTTPLTTKCDTKTSTLIDSHAGNSRQQQICVKCSHDSDNGRDCRERNNHDNNHVKFSDLVDESQTK